MNVKREMNFSENRVFRSTSFVPGLELEWVEGFLLQAS